MAEGQLAHVSSLEGRGGASSVSLQLSGWQVPGWQVQVLGKECAALS